MQNSYQKHIIPRQIIAAGDAERKTFRQIQQNNEPESNHVQTPNGRMIIQHVLAIQTVRYMKKLNYNKITSLVITR